MTENTLPLKPSDFDAAMESMNKLYKSQKETPPEYERIFEENMEDLLT